MTGVIVAYSKFVSYLISNTAIRTHDITSKTAKFQTILLVTTAKYRGVAYNSRKHMVLLLFSKATPANLTLHPMVGPR
jgi:hypothetical protein